MIYRNTQNSVGLVSTWRCYLHYETRYEWRFVDPPTASSDTRTFAVDLPFDAVIKRVWLTKWFDKKRMEMANLSAMKKAETDERKLEQINYELKKLLILENAINWVLPLLFLGVGYAAAYALERALVTFTEILAFVGLSELIGCGISFMRIINKK